MAVYYHDTSALIKHYHAEIGTLVVDKILAEPSSRHFLSRLAGVEMESALAKYVRTKDITATDFQHLRRRFRTEYYPRTVQDSAFAGSTF